jgi:hypothetical protein
MEDEYEPFADEWKKEMCRFTKEQLVNKLADALKKTGDWEYELAYLTDEDVATPKGVKDWVMKKLDSRDI